MPGNFVSSSPAPKARYGKSLHGGRGARAKSKPEYPNTMSFASKSIPSFASRKAKKAESWKPSSR